MWVGPSDPSARSSRRVSSRDNLKLLIQCLSRGSVTQCLPGAHARSLLAAVTRGRGVQCALAEGGRD